MNRNFCGRSGATPDVAPYAIKVDGTTVNLYANPSQCLARRRGFLSEDRASIKGL